MKAPFSGWRNGEIDNERDLFIRRRKDGEGLSKRAVQAKPRDSEFLVWATLAPNLPDPTLFSPGSLALLLHRLGRPRKAQASTRGQAGVPKPEAQTGRSRKTGGLSIRDKRIRGERRCGLASSREAPGEIWGGRRVSRFVRQSRTWKEKEPGGEKEKVPAWPAPSPDPRRRPCLPESLGPR